MTKPKNKRGRPRTGRKPTEVIQARVPPALHAALTKIAERNHRSRNAELVIALEEYLKRAGFWPPKGKAADQPDPS